MVTPPPGPSISVGVLALQGDFAEHLEVLGRLGVEGREVRLPQDLEGLDGLIMPGGESTTFLRLMLDFGLLGPLRARALEGLPLWGACAGMIAMAQRATDLALPTLEVMDIAVRRNAFGRQVDSFEASLEIPVLGPQPFPAVFIRAPYVEEIGPKAQVLARLEHPTKSEISWGPRLEGGIPVAARQGRLLATAFHPELTEDLRFHRYFLEVVSGGRPPQG